jgi:carbon-monoxide dehydrogenase small subunit
MIITLNVNGTDHDLFIEPRRLLSDVLRVDLGLPGTNLGCEHGVCGACTVLVDGLPTRACITLAAQAEGSKITTIEGVGTPENLHPVQEAFSEAHGLQCGFCTPGFVMTVCELVNRSPQMSDAELREELSGNICRCTGYVNIVKAVRLAEEKVANPVTSGCCRAEENNGD